MVAKYFPDLNSIAFLKENPWDRACGKETTEDIEDQEHIMVHENEDLQWSYAKPLLPVEVDEHSVDCYDLMDVDMGMDEEPVSDLELLVEHSDAIDHWESVVEERDPKKHPMYAWHKIKQLPERYENVTNRQVKEEILLDCNNLMGFVQDDGELLLLIDPMKKSRYLKDNGKIIKDDYEV